MPVIPVVENPARGKRRRYTAKQRRYGFGGGPRRSRPKRRRNPPVLAALSNPRRRSRSSRTRRYYARPYRRRRNPDLIKGFDLMSGVFVATGALGSTVIPGLIRRFVPQIPYTGPIAYVVRLGGTAATAFGIGLVTKDRRAPQLVWAGGLALIFVDLFRQYLAPRLGLSGLGQEADFVLTEELEDAISTEGAAGYVSVDEGEGLTGYVETDFNPAIMG